MGQSSPFRRGVFMLLAVWGLLAAAYVVSQRRPRDFAVYMLAAERIVHGDQIYRPDDPPAFTYPPFFALPFVAGLPFPPRIQIFLWSLTNLGLLIAVLAILRSWLMPHMVSADHEAPTSSGTAIWAWAIIGVLSARFLVSPIEYHAHDLILLLLVIVGGIAAARGRHVGSGAWVGLAAACKATPLLFLPVFVAQRRWRACAALLTVLTMATLLPDMIFPSRDGRPWVACWYQNFVSKVNVASAPEANGAWARWDLLNQSLPGTVYRLTSNPDNSSQTNVSILSLSDSQRRVLTLAVEAVVLLLVAAAVWPRKSECWTQERQSLVTMGQFGAVLCGMLLLSPMSSKHHFCALVVPTAFCVVYVFYHRRDPIVAGGLVAMFLLGTMGAKDLVGDEIGNFLQACGSLAFCTLACLIATSWALLRGVQMTSTHGISTSDGDESMELPPGAIIKLRPFQKSA